MGGLLNKPHQGPSPGQFGYDGDDYAPQLSQQQQQMLRDRVSQLQEQQMTGRSDMGLQDINTARNAFGLGNLPQGQQKFQEQYQQNNFGNQPSYGGNIVVGGADSGAGGQGPSQVQQYMNPYLESVLSPQLDALRRQNQIAQNAIGAKFAGSGAFGGGRQAIGQAQANADLMRNLNQTVGQGYANAFDAAQQQFNTEQQRKIQEAQFGADFGLKGLAANRALLEQMAGMGETQRGITSEGIAADKAEFEKQREYPYKQVQFQREALSGLPTSSVTNTPSELSGVAQLLASLGGIDSILKTTGQGSLADIFTSSGIGDLFKGFFSSGTTSPTGTGAGTGTGGST
jgi:hypothetical protein